MDNGYGSISGFSGFGAPVSAQASGLASGHSQTHEMFVQAVRNAAVANGTVSGSEATRLMGAKLTYGMGTGSYRGITVFQAWQNGNVSKDDFVEIAASGEESAVQLAGTTVHELGHILAGPSAGHGKDWRAACTRLGLIDPEASGQEYKLGDFDPVLWSDIAKLADPNDGKPVFTHLGVAGYGGVGRSTFKPCPLGVGTRGGKSRGKGSGSRLRLWVCSCPKPVKVRVSSDAFEATCNLCHSEFKRG